MSSDALGRLRRELAARGVELRARGDKLQVRAPKGALDAGLRAQLQTHKQALLAALLAPARVALNSTQRQLWLGEQLEPGSEAHLLVVRGRLRGALELDRLERALATLIARHDSLRTQFEIEDGVAHQRVLRSAEVPAALLVGPLDSEPDPAAMAIALDRAPLLRLWLAPRGPRDHALELRAHHLILDGVGLEILLDELGRAYAGEALAPAPVQPHELVARDRAHEREPGYGPRLAAWVDFLRDARPVELPCDRRREPTPSTAGGRVHVRVEAPLWDRVQACARTHETTAFVVVACAVGLVCQRWTGRPRVWIGVPHSNRDQPERARAIASLVETTLLELDARENPSVATYLARTKDAWLRCFDHADLALDRVIAALGVRQLPDLTLNFIPFADLGLRLPDVELELQGAMPGARFDLTTYAYPRAGGLELELAYRSALFEHERIEAFAAALVCVLGALVDDPRRPLATIELGLVPPPSPAPIAAMAPPLRARIDAVSPTRIALRGPEGERTYGCVRASASDLSQRLRALELEPGARVAIYAGRRAALACALLGTWAAGLTAVILDPGHPPMRLLAEARAAEVAAWIQAAAEPLPPSLAAAFSTLPRLALATDHRSPPPLPDHSPPDEAIAWLPFTSGTTGQPRGVLVDHGALRRTFAWYLDYFRVAPDERFALLAGLGHDPMLRDLLLPLCAGACVCVPPAEPAQMGPALADWLVEAGVTSLHLTPPLGRVITRADRPLPQLRRVLFTGAPLRGSDLVRWRALAPEAALYNGYGATESPQLAALHPCTDADELAQVVPLGLGVAGTTLVVERSPGRPASIGELGEIVIVGPNLARAYLPALTKPPAGGEVSLDPRLDAATHRYRSGDLGRRRADGAIEFAGRRDRQLGVRGHRIAAAEVEAALLGDDEVREAGVGASEDELVAAVVGPPASAIPRLRATVAARLPAAMVPSHIACVDALPLTANAKLDVEAVIALARARQRAGHPRPRGELERALAALWSGLLGVAEVGRLDDFFALGGHSLLGVELVARVRAELELVAPVSIVFEHPRLADMAAALAALRHADVDPLPTASRDPGDEAPASSAQARLWLLHSLDPDAPQLLLDHELELDEALDLDRLDAALVALERRHEPLRTHFRLAESGLVQVVGSGREQILERVEGRPASARFALDRGPVWRAHAWTEAGQPRLRIQLHHIAGDAAAMTVLIRDLAALYRQRTLAPLKLGYRDLSRWHHAQLDRDPQALEVLSKTLAGISPIALPLAFERPPRQRYRGARVDRRLDPATSEALVARASASGATTFMAALTALFAVLARWTGAGDLAIGTPVGLRPHPAAAQLVGPFLNLAIIRALVTGERSLADLLDEVRGRTLVALARAHVPFERVLDALAPTRALDRTPIVQVLFNMVDGAAIDRAWAELGARRRRPRHPSARYDLAVYAELDQTRGLGLTLVYDRDLFRAAQIDQLADHLVETLTSLARAPDTPVSALALRPSSPRLAPSLPASAPVALFERFEASARTHASRVAITLGHESLTYAALASRARTFAARLEGLGSRACVGLLCDHDATMVAAMLGALARGLTYVPLDPRLPPARLHELIVDGQLDAIASAPTRLELAASLSSSSPGVDLIGLELAAEDAPRPARLPSPDPDAPAYILYTSGSTGRPKGVVQSQRNLIHHAQNYAASIVLEPGEGLSVVANFAFDAAIMDIYGGLLAGARLCLIDLGQARELAVLARRLRALEVAVFHATPTVFRELVAQLDAGEPGPNLRCVVLGGEEARAEDAHAMRRSFGSACVLINGLGPTESTLALQYRLDPGDAIAPGGLPIGRAVPGVRVELRTPLGEQVALHGVGELVLEGHPIALGYWRRPEESAAAFTTLADGRRRYATGDLATYGPEGSLRFVGRRDAQVQIRGRRVELGEIEARLRSEPAIREAGVSLRGGRDQPYLAAHVVVEPEAAPKQIEVGPILAVLAAELPTWMVPRSLTIVPALAKTSTGKLDRRALAALPVESPRESSAASGPEASPASLAAVRRVWSRVLGVDVDPGVDLFAAGGDSLTAVRLRRSLATELELELELAELFEGATVASLAARLDGAQPGSFPTPATLLEAPPGAGLEAHGGELDTVIVLPPGAGPRLAAPLVDALSAAGERPWILRCPSFLGEALAASSHAALARACAEPLATLSGPLRLLGISNGGLIALLIASLRPRTEVALLDTLSPALLAADPWPARSNARRRAAFLAHWAGIQVDPDSLEGSPSQVLARMHTLLEAGARAHEALDIDALARLYAHYVRHANRVWEVLSTIELDALARPDRALLFAAQGPPRLPVTRAWQVAWPTLAVHAVPGDHLGMFGPSHVAELIATIHKVFAEHGPPPRA